MLLLIVHSLNSGFLAVLKKVEGKLVFKGNFLILVKSELYEGSYGKINLGTRVSIFFSTDTFKISMWFQQEGLQ